MAMAVAGVAAIQGVPPHFKSDGLWYAIFSDSEKEEYNLPDNCVYVISPPERPQYEQEEITLPAKTVYNGIEYKVASCGIWVFNGCKNLRTLIFEPPFISIQLTVANCPNLETVVLPTELRHIQGFHTCPRLTSIEFPNGLESVGESSFVGTGLKKLRFPTGFKDIEHSCFSGLPIDELVFEGVEYIGRRSFAGLTGNLRILKFPETLHGLSWQTFKSNTFDEIWFKSRADNKPIYLDWGAFADTSVKRIYCDSRQAPELTGPSMTGWEEDSYDPSSGQPPSIFPFKNEAQGIQTLSDLETITLYVPEGCSDIYANHYYWGMFHIEEHDFSAGIDEPQYAANAFNLKNSEGILAVSGLQGGCIVEVFTPAGQLAGHIQANEYGEAEIALTPGIYIVRAGNHTRKIVVR